MAGTTVRNVVGRHVFEFDATPAGREVYTDSRVANGFSES
jgi:hypothetical protein